MNLKLRRFIANYWVLILLVAIKFILQSIVVNPVYELQRDEFLHLDQANHLAFGFISVPPLTSLISKLILLLGGNLFWIRFFPALFGALTLVFTWLIVEAIGGNLVSKILAGSAILFSVMVRLNILYQPNSFDILAWTVVFYLLIRFIQSNESRWLYYLAVTIVLGLLNKYNLAFLIIGLLTGLLITPERKIVTNPWFWKAILLALILFLPNLIWQAIHHFPVFEHMKALKASQLAHNSSGDFLKGQIMFFFGSIPLSLAALAAFIFFKPFRIYRSIGIAFVTVLTVFTMLKAKDYYALGLYPMIIAFGSVVIEQVLSRKVKWIVIPLLISINLGIFILTASVIYPLYTPVEINQHHADFEKFGLLRWEDGKNHSLPQDFADMIGWREMADKSLMAYQLIPDSEKGNTLIICDNYGQTGALNYYNRKKMPEAYSFNTDYIFWLPRINRIQNVLLVGSEPSQKILNMFSGCQKVGIVENEFAREKGTEIFLLTGANAEFTSMFYKLAQERIDKFDIF